MPTIEIETNVATPAFRRRVARTIAVWASRQGIPINHVIVKYRDLEPSAVFSGPYPFDHFPDRSAQLRSVAFVSCAIAQDRLDGFRQAMAGVITAALQPEVPPDAVLISFRGVSRSDFMLGREAHGATSSGGSS